MKLSALIAPDRPAADVEITGLAADSRAVRPGYLFAALKGVAADGRDFIPEALKAGAAAVLAAPDAGPLPVAHIADANPRRRLAEIAARFYPGQPDTLVAVTGTNGKSSTVEFLRQIWAAAGRPAASLGTLGVRVGDDIADLGHTTPDPIAVHAALDRLAATGCDCAAMEASSHGLAQHRLDGVRLAAAGFSNLTQDHLDYHASFEDYFAAKARLFTELLPAGAPAVVNVDTQWGGRVAEAARAAGHDVRAIGWRGGPLKITEITPRAHSQTLDLRLEGEEIRLDLPLVGEFQALNALLAAGLALATGVDRPAVLGALTQLQGVPGRLQLAGATPQGAPVFIDYAHTPDGVDKLIRAVRPHTQGRVVIVLGCGGDRDPGKRPLMGAAAARLADAVIVTDDNPRSEDPAAIRAAV
ncbi:MAG: UDP-N-acetylmuramoyl-L-alanyl-D-glutamate--2,6-diaminopimelate ligase, partial [Caulobacterales bacterium]|nr:UDP-N-acetylmuramoyl-L-alanyl-D-glutamate--2,6-diaminopimelate ligase [Caulobacterales bacterium]